MQTQRWMERGGFGCLEALPVDNGGTCLIILLLADPHLLEGGQGSQDGATNPDGVLTLRGSNDLEGGEEQTVVEYQGFCW